MDVWEHPTSSVTERYSRLSFSSCFGNKVKNILFNNDLIFSSIVILTRGRIKILTLTEKGKRVLGIKPEKSDRHGGPEHRYWVKAIVERLNLQGFTVTEETSIGKGKTIDILAVRDGQEIAFEIETGKSDVAANVRKCLDANIDKVCIVATSAKLKQGLKVKVACYPNVEVLTGSEVIEGKRW